MDLSFLSFSYYPNLLENKNNQNIVYRLMEFVSRNPVEFISLNPILTINSYLSMIFYRKDLTQTIDRSIIFVIKSLNHHESNALCSLLL
jgi:hypothetical protein